MINTKKVDAVRRCLKEYECQYIAKEKLKHFVSKDAFNHRWFGKKSYRSILGIKIN